MHSYCFEQDGIVFSFLDSGGQGKPLIALNGHWMRAPDFSALAEDLAPIWWVIGLDQRGFGETDHAMPHAMSAYVFNVIAWPPSFPYLQTSIHRVS